MTKTTLANIATVVRGVSFDKSDVSDSAGSGLLPILRAGNIEVELDLRNDLVWVPSSKVSREQLLKPGDIPICMSSGSPAVVGKSAILRNPWQGSVGAFCAVVRANPKFVLPEFLAFFLRSHSFRIWTKNSSGSSIKNIKKSGLEEYSLDMPGLDEQRSIVELLSRAESIVRLRRDAQQKAAELVPAIFRKMFGDPESNPHGLRLRKVSDFIAQFQGGKNIQAGSDNPNGPRILKVSAVTSGRYLESESKPAPDNYAPPISHVVKVGDMLFSRANTVDLVGATAIVESTDGMTLLPDKLWRIIWSEDVDVAYMHTLFQDNSVRRMLSKLATGTSDSMRNISQSKLFELVLPVASIANQRKFGAVHSQSQSIFTEQSAALHKAIATFGSLMSQSFGGGHGA